MPPRPVVAVVAAQEVGRLGRLEVADVEALLGQRLGDGVVRAAGDGDQQQGPAGGVGQPGEAPLVGAHEPGAEPDRFDRQRRRPGHRKLEQGQRVARGRLPGGAGQRGRRPEQLPGRAQVEPADGQLRQGPEPALHRGRRVGARPRREQHGDRLGPHPAHREHQRLEGGQVQAVRVVDGDQQGPLLGGVREQAQRRHRDAEPVARPGAEVQRPLQGGGLGPGEGRDAVEQRPEQQRQRRVGDLALGLVAVDPDDPERAGDLRVGDRRVEQAGLADAGVAADRQRARCAGGRIGEGRPQTITLCVASDENGHRGHGRDD